MGAANLTNSVDNLANCSESWRETFDREMPGRESRPRAMLLGLPCSRCSAYYAADLDACPMCGCTVRVGPAMPAATVVM
jgi:hypothetical protein